MRWRGEGLASLADARHRQLLETSPRHCECLTKKTSPRGVEQLSPEATTTEAERPRVCALQEKPLQREACVPR